LHGLYVGRRNDRSSYFLSSKSRFFGGPIKKTAIHRDEKKLGWFLELEPKLIINEEIRLREENRIKEKQIKELESDKERISELELKMENINELLKRVTLS